MVVITVRVRSNYLPLLCYVAVLALPLPSLRFRICHSTPFYSTVRVVLSVGRNGMASAWHGTTMTSAVGKRAENATIRVLKLHYERESAKQRANSRELSNRSEMRNGNLTGCGGIGRGGELRKTQVTLTAAARATVVQIWTKAK